MCEVMWKLFLCGCLDEPPRSTTLHRDTGTEATLSVSATSANLLNGHRDEAAMSRTDEEKLRLSLLGFSMKFSKQQKGTCILHY